MNGICVPQHTTIPHSYTCSCVGDWVGQYCDIQRCDGDLVCQNGGSCGYVGRTMVQLTYETFYIKQITHNSMRSYKY